MKKPDTLSIRFISSEAFGESANIKLTYKQNAQNESAVRGFPDTLWAFIIFRSLVVGFPKAWTNVNQ